MVTSKLYLQSDSNLEAVEPYPSKRTTNLFFHKKEHLRIRFFQKQPPKGVLKKRCSGNIQQIYRRNPCQSAISHKLQTQVEITLWHGCSPVNLLHIFSTDFSRNTSGWLLLTFINLWMGK